jgi:ABC-type branched-subunit amino acid transport system permease subunit
MASTKRTWLWIIFGVIGFIALGLVALVGGGAYVVSRHVKSELVGKTSAEEQFVRQRARFAGQQPLVEVEGADRADMKASIHRQAEGGAKVELQTMRVLIYDAHDGRLVHVDLPFWLLHLMPAGRLGSVSGNFSFNSSDRITVDDLERHGPGLILDARDSRDAQILIWTE